MEIIKLKKENLSGAISLVAKFIRQGKVLTCPTDTVYGLICDAKNKKAVAKIFKIKKRSWKKPLSLFVRDLKMAKEVAKIDKTQEKFLKDVWPGQAIVVLKVATKFPKGIISESGNVGLRIPDSFFLNNLLSVIGFPLAQTSANISGEPPTNNVKDVLKGPDLILDGGKLKSKKPSRVIDLTQKKPKIIRA